MTTTILAAIGSAVVILNAVTRLPQAISDLARACIPAVTALRELHAVITGRRRSCGSRGEGDADPQGALS
jgi:hypothetical protein